MKLGIIGGGLTSLSLAKSLVNQGMIVDLFFTESKSYLNKGRTIGISKENLDFFNKNILDIKNITWDIDKIEIFSDKLSDENILNFEKNNEPLFGIIKNYELQKKLLSNLSKNKLCNFKTKKNYKNLKIKDYNLIINCDSNTGVSKNFFFQKIKKNYKSFANTAIITHKKIKNNIATQTFTRKGPIAFLPISATKTSIVYSIKGNQNLDLKNLIKKYNKKYSILKFSDFGSFELKASNLRTYYYKNILAFGDLLHKIHPLAGQGFNMSIRDIKVISELIKFKLDLGLEIDSSICIDFEKRAKHKNYLFSKGIDLVYEFFNLEGKINNNVLTKSIQLFGKNKFLNKSFEKIANSGLQI